MLLRMMSLRTLWTMIEVLRLMEHGPDCCVQAIVSISRIVFIDRAETSEESMRISHLLLG